MPERPIKLTIAALGGQGGGVLADWLIEIAEAEDYIAQSTSVPGVAQRTGATIYYLEFFPRAAALRAGRDLRVRRAAGAVVTAAGRVQARNQVAPDTAKEQSTAHAVTVAEPLTFIAHGSPGDVGEVAPFTKKHAGPPVHSPEGAACSAVVGPVPLASRLSSSDALCCNQVGWGCPSRCRS